MRRSFTHRRGFTLLEVMMASAIGVIVLGVGLVAGMQMQRRAIFEEQTMMAQVAGRAVKDLLTADLQRAGLGMGNTPVTFGENDHRIALQSWTNLDMNVTTPTGMATTPAFALPPAGGPYANFRSDVLRLYWGDTRTMAMMGPCSGHGRIREGNSDNYCLKPNVVATGLQPIPPATVTPALLVNPELGTACHLEVSSTTTAGKINANPGSNGVYLGPSSSSACGRGNQDDPWATEGWITMRTAGAAYRVNWAGGAPALEYLAPGATSWVVVSRDVERLKVRHAVADLTAPNTAYRWFPDVGRPAIDACTVGDPACAVNPVPNLETAATTNADLRRQLWQRVREVEVTLVIRTQRADRTAFNPNAPITETDEDGYPKDGFKRRTYTFRVSPRNLSSGWLQPPQGT